MTPDYQAALEPLIRIRGARGALLASRTDGLVVAELLMEGVDGAALAALASSLMRRLDAAADAADAGPPAFVLVQASGGLLLVAPAGGELVTVLIADRGVNVGRARLDLARLADWVS